MKKLEKLKLDNFEKISVDKQKSMKGGGEWVTGPDGSTYWYVGEAVVTGSYIWGNGSFPFYYSNGNSGNTSSGSNYGSGGYPGGGGGGGGTSGDSGGGNTAGSGGNPSSWIQNSAYSFVPSYGITNGGLAYSYNVQVNSNLNTVSGQLIVGAAHTQINSNITGTATLLVNNQEISTVGLTASENGVIIADGWNSIGFAYFNVSQYSGSYIQVVIKTSQYVDKGYGAGYSWVVGETVIHIGQ